MKSKVSLHLFRKRNTSARNKVQFGAFRASTTWRMNLKCWASRSTETTRPQPRESSSMVMLPVPANKSIATGLSSKSR